MCSIPASVHTFHLPSLPVLPCRHIMPLEDRGRVADFLSYKFMHSSVICLAKQHYYQSLIQRNSGDPKHLFSTFSILQTPCNLAAIPSHPETALTMIINDIFPDKSKALDLFLTLNYLSAILDTQSSPLLESLHDLSFQCSVRVWLFFCLSGCTLID